MAPHTRQGLVVLSVVVRREGKVLINWRHPDFNHIVASA
jgi:hypothetical protein